jgi:hypothetical protein
MAVTFYGTASVPVILKTAKWIQKLKHTHTHTHTHMDMSYAACKLFGTLKTRCYDENEIQFALCY